MTDWDEVGFELPTFFEEPALPPEQQSRAVIDYQAAAAFNFLPMTDRLND